MNILKNAHFFVLLSLLSGAHVTQTLTFKTLDQFILEQEAVLHARLILKQDKVMSKAIEKTDLRLLLRIIESLTSHPALFEKMTDAQKKTFLNRIEHLRKTTILKFEKPLSTAEYAQVAAYTLASCACILGPCFAWKHAINSINHPGRPRSRFREEIEILEIMSIVPGFFGAIISAYQALNTGKRWYMQHQIEGLRNMYRVLKTTNL